MGGTCVFVKSGLGASAPIAREFPMCHGRRGRAPGRGATGQRNANANGNKEGTSMQMPVAAGSRVEEDSQAETVDFHFP